MNTRPAHGTSPLANAPADVFERAFHASPALHVVVRWPERVVVDVNAAFLTTFGYTREELIGRSPEELPLWVSQERALAFREELATHRRVRGYEIEALTKTGGRRNVMLWADVFESDGVMYAVASGVDITERQHVLADLKATHERLRRSEERFSQAFRSNPAMVAITRFNDGVFVSVNDAFLRTTGYTEAEMIGRTAKDLQLHAMPTQRDTFMRGVAEHGFTREVEVVVRTKSGELRTLLASGEITDLDGTPHLLSVALDITARKVAEAKLRESEQRLRDSEARFSTAFRASPVLMTMAMMPEARFVEANDAFLQTFGFTREQTIGRTTLELGIWVTRDDRTDFFDRLRASVSLRNIEIRARRHDGEVRTILVSADIIEINQQQHVLTFGLDITDRKRAEIEQHRALQKERELRQLKTDFVSLVSHEFRTPLEVIMSSVDNLDRYHERLPVDQRQQLLRTINKSVRRMAGMMEEVLLLGRLESGRTVFKPAAIDLGSLCQRVCDEMESATNRRCPITLSLALGGEPARGDEAVLRHILTNLLSNAVKYSAAGRPAQLAAAREGANAVFRISDEGCGIPAPDQQRLFQAFHRGSNVRQIPGTGLGLLIVRRCVDLHGGEIGFESVEGRGTTFTVRLPLYPA